MLDLRTSTGATHKSPNKLSGAYHSVRALSGKASQARFNANPTRIMYKSPLIYCGRDIPSLCTSASHISAVFSF